MRTKQWHAIGMVVALAAMSAPSGWAAEVIDVTRSVSSSGSIASVATLAVTPITISTGLSAASLAFGQVTTGASPWVRAPQYLRLQYQSNQVSWAVRVLTNNRTAFPSMVGFVTDPGQPGDADDKLGYAGMIGTVPTNVLDRVSLAWQVYKDPVAGGPPAPTGDTDVTPVDPANSWQTPWASVADASDCLSNCRTATPGTIDKTGEYFRIVQGGPSSSGLLAHPNDNNRIGDNDIAVYVAARFGGAPADSYGATIILEMYHF